MEIKEIPGTKGFSATISGDIFDSKGKIRKQYLNGDGYKTVAVITSNGKWQTFGLHRLLAITFIECNGEIKNMSVNHIDGNIKNNSITNLEWITPAKNNLHAILLRGSKIRPVILAKNPDGIFEFISNLDSCAKKLSCEINLVWESIRDNKKLNGWILCHHNRKRTTPDLPTELRKDNFTGGRGIGKLKLRQITIFDLETQTCEDFDSLHSAGIKHGVSTSAIYQLISVGEKIRLFKKRFLIVDKGKPIPEINQEKYESLLSPGGKEVVAFNIEEKILYIFSSASQFIKEKGLSKKSVTVDLKNKRLRLLGSWWYTYNSLENLEKMSVAIGCPDLMAFNKH